MKKILLIPIAALILTGCSNQNNKDIIDDSAIKNTYKTLVSSASPIDIPTLKTILSDCEFIEDKYFIMDNNSISHKDVFSYSFKNNNELLNIELLDDDNINLTYQIENNKENSNNLSYDFDITKNTNKDTLSANYLFSDAKSKELFINNQNTLRKFDNQSNIYKVFINLEKDIKNSIPINQIEQEFRLDFKKINNDDGIDYIHISDNEKLILTVNKFNILTNVSYENSDIMSYCVSYASNSPEDSDFVYGIIINDISNQELKSL